MRQLSKILLLFAASLNAQSFTGMVEGPPHDGDTLSIRTKTGLVKIRLFGADAPELKQEGGEESRRSLARIAPIGSTLVCEDRGKSFDRVVATCRTFARQVDISEHQVRAGHALVWTAERQKAPGWGAWQPKPPKRYTVSKKAGERYAYIRSLLEAEQEAAKKAVGMWSNRVPPVPAWQWRKR